MVEGSPTQKPASPQDLKRKFGQRLAALRKERSLTQEKLARLIKKDPVFVAYMEGGKRSPSFATIYNLSKALEVTPQELFRF